MNCDITMLTLYWSGELSQEEAEQVEAHLTYCTACRQELAELNAMDESVKALPQEQAPRDFVSPAVKETDSRSTSVLAFIRRPIVAYPSMGGMAIAAAILIMVMGPWFTQPAPVAEILPQLKRQSGMALYAKAVDAKQRVTARKTSLRRTTNFRARAGHLTKRIRLAKRLTFRRNTTVPTTR